MLLIISSPRLLSGHHFGVDCLGLRFPAWLLRAMIGILLHVHSVDIIVVHHFTLSIVHNRRLRYVTGSRSWTRCRFFPMNLEPLHKSFRVGKCVPPESEAVARHVHELLPNPGVWQVAQHKDSGVFLGDTEEIRNGVGLSFLFLPKLGFDFLLRALPEVSVLEQFLRKGSSGFYIPSQNFVQVFKLLGPNVQDLPNACWVPLALFSYRDVNKDIVEKLPGDGEVRSAFAAGSNYDVSNVLILKILFGALRRDILKEGMFDFARNEGKLLLLALLDKSSSFQVFVDKVWLPDHKFPFRRVFTGFVRKHARLTSQLDSKSVFLNGLNPAEEGHSYFECKLLLDIVDVFVVVTDIFHLDETNKAIVQLGSDTPRR